MAGRPGTVRALLFKNYSHAGTYNLAIESDKNGTDTSLNVSTLSSYGGSKTGFNVGFDQEIASFLGAFLRISGMMGLQAPGLSRKSTKVSAWE